MAAATTLLGRDSGNSHERRCFEHQNKNVEGRMTNLVDTTKGAREIELPREP
jgi:hypothetical protein